MVYGAAMGDIGSRLRQVRRENGWTQTDLAERLQMTKASVSNFETGATLPSLQTLITFAAETGVSLDWLLLGKEPAGEYDRRIRDLPEPLRDYVVQNLLLAELVRRRPAIQFARAPKPENLPKFAEMLLELAERP